MGTVLAGAGLLAAGAAPAQGASRLIVRGAGFGHGVGMSQYGAYGFAKRGADHARILGHYYSGTQLGKLGGSSEVRVLLKRSGRIKFRGARSIAGRRSLSTRRTYTARRAPSGAVLLRSSSGRSLGTYKAPLRISGSSKGVLVRGRADNDRVNGRYRGDLELRPGGLGMSAINVVDREDYIRGVVAGEMPSSWAPEALRSQAVAARTYAIATRKDGDGFDHYADTRSQVYLGISGEERTTNAAVAATAGEVVTYEGEPVVTYYFSTSGGRTENVENSFLGADPAPWLKSVADPFDDESPLHTWRKRMSLRSADRRLGGLVKGRLRRIKVLSRGRSPRVVRAQLVGTRGRRTVSGPTLRSELGLYDTWARFTVITARGRRGDGNRPRSEEPKDSGSGSGGSAASAASIASAVGDAAVAGRISGRVSPAVPGREVVVQRRAGSEWVDAARTVTRRGGRYRVSVAASGRYRVRYEGESGPSVRVR
ncbi:MAG: SpoIID/LytB domain-containing protein [Solirubrobacteraceae bacterium]